ncbi:methyltransferase [Nonomuraea sp. NPDC048826]|uniref:methyltransferase n=1 Tax=Nonomuraea sp. NPDC048826 TaxID=3364347 RepID=UPI003721E999
MLPDPSQRLLGYINGAWVASAVCAAAELGLADALAGGPRDSGQVARAVGAHPDALYRLLRALADLGVLRELDGRVFELTETGERLRRDHPESQRGFAVMLGSSWHRQAWSGFADSVRTGEPAFERAFGRPAFEHFRDHPEHGEVLNDAMTSASAAFVWPAVRDHDFTPYATVVDVGGGHGALLAAILAAHPGARGVLFDLPHVIEGAGGPLAEAGVADRCELVGGDFFASVPPGGDAYLMSNIIHDWGDDDAVRILANCRKAMNDGGRVLLCEAVIPDPPREPTASTLIDLEMLVIAGGARQRTVSEFAGLFERAGLRLTGVTGEGVFDVVAATAG